MKHSTSKNDLLTLVKGNAAYKNMSRDGELLLKALTNGFANFTIPKGAADLELVLAKWIYDERTEWRNEGRTEGRTEGRENALVQAIKNVAANVKTSIDGAMDILQIPADERPCLAKMLAAN